ncbi:hypothetical protein PTKIN_Ptkin12aG0115000 [Pterospermum kingtungense]
MMNAFSEGLVLAERSGLNPHSLLDVLRDIRLALALGDENALSMLVAVAANEAFKKARSLDFSTVFEIVKVLKHSS